MRLNFFSKTATLAVFEKSIEKFIFPCILSDIGIFLYSILPPLRLAFRLIRYPYSQRLFRDARGFLFNRFEIGILSDQRRR